MSLTIVVMAAGVGSRFGGPKQLEPVGPAGETLIDYLLVDARRAGFDRAVLVIRDELTARIEPVADRHRGGLDVVLAYQTMGPDIPRGTVPAVLAAADRIDGPFVALNADDFYGTVAYQRAADFLRDDRVAGHHARVRVVPAARHALAARRGRPRRVRDQRRRPGAGGRDPRHRAGRRRSEESRPPVHRRRTGLDELLGFSTEHARRAAARVRRLPADGHDSSHELLLPVTVDWLVTEGRIQVRVLSAPGPWLGLTHASDLPGARQALAGMPAAGDYPTPAWQILIPNH